MRHVQRSQCTLSHTLWIIILCHLQSHTGLPAILVDHCLPLVLPLRVDRLVIRACTDTAPKPVLPSGLLHRPACQIIKVRFEPFNVEHTVIKSEGCCIHGSLRTSIEADRETAIVLGETRKKEEKKLTTAPQGKTRQLGAAAPHPTPHQSSFLSKPSSTDSQSVPSFEWFGTHSTRSRSTLRVD